jgi:hypothetical protein
LRPTALDGLVGPFNLNPLSGDPALLLVLASQLVERLDLDRGCEVRVSEVRILEVPPEVIPEGAPTTWERRQVRVDVPGEFILPPVVVAGAARRSR